MALDALILRYGVLAVLVGAGIEGEAVVVTGGVLAHRGLIPLVPACIAAAIGSCVVDQLWFIAGRRLRDRRFVRAITERPAYARAIGILERYPTSFILAFRFIYGLRTVSPVAIGTSRIPARRFVPLNIVAAAVWGPAFTLLGYALGKAAVRLMHRIAGVGTWVIGIAVAVALVAALAAYLVRRRTAAD
jgi:membrane protein DedA with SNARE-associated domain